MGIIRWNERDVRFHIVWGSNPKDIQVSDCTAQVEYDVLGNVHDNPGLCEEINGSIQNVFKRDWH